ncbi:sugar ABC transporter ATP-binding protein [Georgenia sp. AZ-5]|uniref:sugar ABC transporter ATP-binding protein n=1 Tax=Georgenia sp. AZ-5 TaxID=3367526 RepID=UPI00375540F4
MTLIRAEQISKSFSGVQVLDRVDLALQRGTLTGLVGENGAGKSTLIKVLTGLIRPDSGRIVVDDEPVTHWSQTHARDAGVSVIHQELLLVPDLTVAQNIMLGEPLRHRDALRRALGVRDERANERRAGELLHEIGITDIDVTAPVRGISPSHAQMVLIARSLRRDARVLILDEPTAALAPHERDELFRLLRRLLARGTAILYVSHHLQEVQDLADAVSVLRNGRVVAELRGAEITIPTMIQAMLDRSLEDQFPPVEHEPADVVLRVDHMASGSGLKDVSLTVRRGEILGITGLLGAGKTELARALVGLDATAGVVAVDGEDYEPAGPREGVRKGLVLVPEERKAQAVFPDLSVYRNGVVSLLNRGVRQGGVQLLLPGSRAVQGLFRTTVSSLGVKYAHEGQHLARLSGGNQQKLVIGRALTCGPRVLVLDEPTRGVDVGSKREIYRIIVEQAAAGLGVVLISSDTREVLALAHRILVLRDGIVTAELDPRNKTHEELTMLLSPSEIPDAHAHGQSED